MKAECFICEEKNEVGFWKYLLSWFGGYTCEICSKLGNQWKRYKKYEEMEI